MRLLIKKLIRFYISSRVEEKKFLFDLWNRSRHVRKEMQVVTEANLQRICLQVTLCRGSKHYGAGIALGSAKRDQS